MSVTATDWITAVSLLVALLLVRRFKTQIQADSAESYDGIAGGLTILALTGLARLYSSLGLFETVPFLSETVFFDLVYWIGVITGATFVIGGVSNWLPLARNHRRYNRTRIEHLELLRRVEQLIGVESRLDTVLATALQYMTEQMAFAAGAVFKCSPARATLILGATTRDFPVDPERLTGVSRAATADRSWQGLPPEIGRPSATLPITVGGKAVGYFLLWHEVGVEADSDDRLTLRLVADVVARKVETDRLVLRHRAEDSLRGWRARMQDAVGRVGDSRKRLAALARILSERVPFEYASILIVDNDSNKVKRYSTATDGRVLVEAGLPLPDKDSLAAPALYSRQTAVYNDLEGSLQPGRAEMVTGGPVMSLLAMPLETGGAVNAVLLLASPRSDVFDSRIQTELQTLEGLLALVVLPDLLSGTSARGEDRLAKLQRLTSIAARAETSDSVMATAAELIADELGSDLTRLSVLDDSGAFLESKALVSTGSTGAAVPANGQMILSLMTRHRQALAAGQSLYVDVRDGQPAMAAIERRQAFSEEVRCAFLLPVAVRGGKTVVVSAAGFADELPRALVPDTRRFVRAVVELLALEMSRDTVRTTAPRHRIPADPTVAADDRFEYRPVTVGRTARRLDARVLEESPVG